VAEKRLSAIKEFTQFGAGFKIAMRDLEIRGAGNLLGAEQSGHMESVGYDMFVKILERAVLEEKGEAPTVKPECTVSLNIDAYIPEKYIRSTAQRIDAYKKIASVENEEDMFDVYDELADRYGPLPKQADILLKISLIRAIGRFCEFEKIERHAQSVIFYTKTYNFEAWKPIIAEYKGKVMLSAGNIPYVTLKISDINTLLDEILALLKKYIQKMG
jgi:transcription-repair coupling factor (superfamily II helicase)